MELEACSSAPRAWSRYRIAEICIRFTSGGTPSRKIAAYYRNGNIPWVKTKELNGNYIFTTEEYITTEGLMRSSAKLLPRGTVLLAMYGATVGALGKLATPMACNQACAAMVTDEKRFSSNFLFYQLLLHENQIKSLATGAAQQNLSGEQVKNFILPFPPFHEQNKIANTLHALDEKIDLNRRTNETLEAMARALFRDWFVDFGPTRAKMAGEAPYLAPELWELFPDRLDDEGKPEGWKICNFNELVSINPKEPLSRNTIAPYLSMSELPTQGCLTEAPIPRPFSGGSKFRNEDTLFARITPCLENGKTALAQNLENNIVGWGSTEFHVLRGKGNVPFSWVYLMARDNEFRANAIRGMTGTSGRQRVASEVLATYKTVTPSGNQIWKAFDHACNPLFEKIIINGAESRTLAQLRDLLLPKLMSGEISIRDAEKMVEDTA